MRTGEKRVLSRILGSLSMLCTSSTIMYYYKLFCAKLYNHDIVVNFGGLFKIVLKSSLVEKKNRFIEDFNNIILKCAELTEKQKTFLIDRTKEEILSKLSDDTYLINYSLLELSNQAISLGDYYIKKMLTEIAIRTAQSNAIESSHLLKDILGVVLVSTLICVAICGAIAILYSNAPKRIFTPPPAPVQDPIDLYVMPEIMRPVVSKIVEYTYNCRGIMMTETLNNRAISLLPSQLIRAVGAEHMLTPGAEWVINNTYRFTSLTMCGFYNAAMLGIGYAPYGGLAVGSMIKEVASKGYFDMTFVGYYMRSRSFCP